MRPRRSAHIDVTRTSALNVSACRGFSVDYMGIWNERGADSTWTKQLRQAMDAAGYDNTRIVAGDTGWEIVGQMAADPELAAAIDVVGVHYPGAPPSQVYSLNKSIWASEMWNLGVVDDWHGAGVLASDLAQHALWGLSSSILWCLIYSWYAILPFSTPTDTNAGLGHAILTAAEPWSGHYDLNPVIYAMAHHTQFAQPGWTYLSINSTGMGSLPGGGTYVTAFNSHVPAGQPLVFSLIMQTNVGASSAQTVTFTIANTGAAVLPSSLAVWQTTEAAYFQQLASIPVASDGTFTVTIPADAMVTVSSFANGQGPATPVTPIPASAPFPFPYADDFDGASGYTYPLQGYARYFCDEGGLWIVQQIPSDLLPAPVDGSTSAGAASGNAYYNVVDTIPIAWETNPPPYTLIGNFNGGSNQSAWTDYTVSAQMMIDPSAQPHVGDIVYAEINNCNDSAVSQQWIAVGGDFVTTPAYLQSVLFPSLCLGIIGPDPVTPGATAVGLLPCNATPSGSQYMPIKWQYTQTTQITATETGQCMDIDTANTTAGTHVVTWPCKTPASNQAWTYTTAGAGQPITLQSAYATSPVMCVDLAPPQPGKTTVFLMLSLRMHSYTRNGAPPDGYNFYLYPGANTTAAGSWKLAWKGNTLAEGDAVIPVVPGVWYSMAVVASGTTISVQLNGAALTGGTVNDSNSGYGMVAIGSGWHHAWFDNFKIGNNTASF